MDINNNLSQTNENMEKTFNKFKTELTNVRVGRAHASMLDNIKVDVYGSKLPISQVATVNVPEPRLLVVSVWDNSHTKLVEQAIVKSDLDINPVVEGQVLRLNIPALTEERRKDVVKMVSKMTEDAKIAIRSVRRNSLDKIKKENKDKLLSDDDSKRLSDEVQKITDNFIENISKAYKVKEEEILKV